MSNENLSESPESAVSSNKVGDLIRNFFSLVSADGRFDPYLLWGLLTHFKSLQVEGKLPAVLNFTIEFKQPYTLTGLFPLMKESGPVDLATDPTRPRFEVPRAYEALLHTRQRPRFVTARWAIEKLEFEEILTQLEKLLVDDSWVRIQMGQPRGQGADKPYDKDPEVPNNVSPVILGVIDDACPFAHGQLRQAGNGLTSRVLALWDQSSVDKGSGPWSNNHAFTYGRQLDQSAINSLLQAHSVDGDVDEMALYQQTYGDLRALGRRESHAAAVVGLFAGSRNLAAPRSSMADEGLAGATLTDRAATAPVVAVRLPAEQTDVRAGRWLAVNALDALHYLIDIARRVGEASNNSPKLVVNMSYGAMAGPHDGSGMLESAIDELCKDNDRLAVVLAAGNSHGMQRSADLPLVYQPGGFHACHELTPKKRVRFTLFIPPDKALETYLELWFTVIDPPPDSAGEGLLPSEVEITVTQPQGETSEAVPCPGLWLSPSDPSGSSSEPQAGLLFFQKVSQSPHRSMALLVVAPTQVADAGPAPSGRWQIDVQSHGERKLQVDAWVERDDTTVGATRPQSARLVENTDGSDSGLIDTNTFSNIATGRQAFRVGALMDRGQGLNSTLVSPYSSAAVDDQHGPEFSAIADDNPALPGIRVSGSHSGMVVRGNGTSLAAPQAARWIAEQIERGMTPDVIRNSLPQNTGDARRGKKTV